MNEKKFFLPRYSLVPVGALALFQCLGYFTADLWSCGTPTNVAIWLDAQIPLWPPAALIYALSFLQWVIGILVVARQEEPIAHRWIAAVMYALAITFVIFAVFPTTTVRPEIPGHGVFQWILSIIYAVDRPTRLFPSIHCMEAWLAVRALFACKNIPRRYLVLNTVFAVAVIASTVLTKQHLVVDIPGGILVAELGIFLSGKYVPRFYRCLDAAQKP